MAFPVTNGEKANQTTFNKVAGRLVDNDFTGKQNLNNAESASGPNVTNLQREVNSQNSYTGRPAGSAFDAVPAWANNDVGASTDDLTQRAEALTLNQNNVTGHSHNGDPGGGAPISAANLIEVNNFFGIRSTKTITVAGGTDDDVSTDFAADTPGGADAVVGVVTTPPRNKVEILDNNGEYIEDGSGNRVYARLTWAASVWTLSYFVNNAGTETAYSLTGQTIKIFYREVFDQQDRPTFGADFGDMLTADETSDVVDASPTQRGLVSTGNQSFAGDKTFTGAIAASNFSGSHSGTSSGSNTGDVTLGTIGAVPNANGASLSGQVLTLQPADSTFGGVLTAVAQSILGLKTFLSGVVAATVLRGTGKWESDVENDATSGAVQTLALPNKHIVRLTNAALVSVTGITAPTQAQKIVLINRTGVQIQLLNDSGTAANRILTGTGTDLDLAADAAVTLDYDLTTAKWQVVGGSGSGSGGGALQVFATENISAAGTVTAAAEQREFRRVQGNGAAVTANTTTPITAGTIEGQELILKGMSDTNTLTIENSGNVDLNGDVVLYSGSTLCLVWIDSKWLETSRSI
jgi:hypothetical protein